MKAFECPTYPQGSFDCILSFRFLSLLFFYKEAGDVTASMQKEMEWEGGGAHILPENCASNLGLQIHWCPISDFKSVGDTTQAKLGWFWSCNLSRVIIHITIIWAQLKQQDLLLLLLFPWKFLGLNLLISTCDIQLTVK